MTRNGCPVDIVHGGFHAKVSPVLDLAGSMTKGVGKLFDIMMDKIEQLDELPKFLVFENVPNLLIGARGTWFETSKIGSRNWLLVLKKMP